MLVINGDSVRAYITCMIEKHLGEKILAEKEILPFSPLYLLYL